MPWEIPQGLGEALDQLVTADPQNNRKGKYVVEWFKDEFGVKGRASVVTERKQVGNRVSEQFRHKSPHVIFVTQDEDTYNRLVVRAKDSVYPELKTVLILMHDEDTFEPRLLLRQGESEVSSFYENTFEDLPVDEVHAIGPNDGVHGEGVPGAEAHEEGAAYEPHVNWAPPILEDEKPHGLVGLNKQVRQAIAALRAGKHIILVGPPGTGKSELAEALCESLGVAFDLVTATSDWTSFDTIGGYMPDPGLGGPPEPLNFFPMGIVKAMDEHKWVIVDELNRADIDKAFAEMFTLLSSKRGIRLPYFHRDAEGNLKRVVLGATGETQDHVITMSPDWRIIGTMNTFDKASLFQLSFAFMRRFAFIDVPLPATEDYKSILLEQASALWNSDEEADLRDQCLAFLYKVFAPDEEEGLSRLGLGVGPSIPRDIIRYIKERHDIETDVFENDEVDVSALVLEGVEMYLYPQFEGQDEKHIAIVTAIGEALGLDDEGVERTSRLLKAWTGYEEGIDE